MWGSLVLFTAGFALAGLTPNRTFSAINATSREQLIFVEYTPEQRVRAAKGLQNMFSIYVHRDKKIATYGAEYKRYSGIDIDPVPRSVEIAKKAAEMTDKEFHYAYVDLFYSLRDLHTNYEMPAPHACYGFLQAPTFTVVDNFEGGILQETPKLVVKDFSNNVEINRLSYPMIARMNIGDTVLSIDGKTFPEYIESVKWLTGGTGESAALRSAISYMSARSGRFAKAPKKDTTTYVLQSFNDASKIYNVTLPWILMRRDDCIANYNAFKKKAHNRGISNFRNIVHKYMGQNDTVKELIRNSQEIKDNLFQGVNKKLLFFKEFFAESAGFRASKIQFHPTADRIIYWAIYDPGKKNMGIIAIESFAPRGGDISGVINLIRGLLINELKDTSCLLLDLRDNGGGIIQMADILPQLFASANNVVPSGARALKSPANDYIFTNATSATDNWYNATVRNDSSALYSPLITFTTESQANNIGVAYLRPVGYFHNGNCFSACDLMAANVQDNKVATIFSEDVRSGGGGANVIEYVGFLNKIAAPFFPPLPFQNDTDSTPLDARVSWRQSVRVGVHEGALIEDDAVLADVQLIRPSILDLLPGTTSNSQYDRIWHKLAGIGETNGMNKVYFQAFPEYESTYYIGQATEFAFDITGVPQIQIYDVSTKLLVSTMILESLERQMRHVRFDSEYTIPGYVNFEIRGVDKDGHKLFSTFRLVRYLPNPNDALSISVNQTVVLDLSGKGPEVGQYNIDTPKEKGFVSNGTFLQIADGQMYSNNIFSQRSFFLRSTSLITVKLDAEYSTELGFDFFYFGYIKNGNTTQLLSGPGKKPGIAYPAVSGNGTIVPGVNGTFLIPPGDLELFVRFSSDGAITGKGVKVNQITVRGVTVGQVMATLKAKAEWKKVAHLAVNTKAPLRPPPPAHETPHFKLKID